ncbi:MAG: ISAs1 family transposase, partial [Muribaculaceae bacterium]|nr:ISAs1 family transposase [Muribaculaceae bacterium]
MTNTPSPIVFFSSVTDPRVERTQKHSLDSILFISLCAVICGAESWNEIEDYGNAKIDWLEKFLYLPNGIPSHDTFNRVISMLDPKELNDSFVAWTKSIAELTDGEVVAIDGKCLRGSSDEGTGTYTHLVSAWASANNLLLAQEKVSGKSNEITAIPRLLRILELRNCIVTIDAMGCQREIAKTIMGRGADYILALKGNQPEMLERVSGSFTYLKPSSVHKMEGKSHGREESRICSVITNLENIIDKDRWPGLKSLIMIESRMGDIKSGELHKEIRYYISSLEADAQYINHS